MSPSADCNPVNSPCLVVTCAACMHVLTVYRMTLCMLFESECDAVHHRFKSQEVADMKYGQPLTRLMIKAKEAQPGRDFVGALREAVRAQLLSNLHNQGLSGNKGFLLLPSGCALGHHSQPTRAAESGNLFHDDHVGLEMLLRKAWQMSMTHMRFLPFSGCPHRPAGADRRGEEGLPQQRRHPGEL